MNDPQAADDMGDNTVVYQPSLYRRDFTAAVREAHARPVPARLLTAMDVLFWLAVGMAVLFFATALAVYAPWVNAAAAAQASTMMEL